MEGFDISLFPNWLVTVLILINIFKGPLSQFLPESLRDWSRNTEAARIRKEQREDKNLDSLLDLIKDKEEFERSFYQSLVNTVKDNTEALIDLRVTQQDLRGVLSRLVSRYDTAKDEDIKRAIYDKSETHSNLQEE